MRRAAVFIHRAGIAVAAISCLLGVCVVVTTPAEQTGPSGALLIGSSVIGPGVLVYVVALLLS